MSGKAAAITITEKQQAILHRIVRAKTSTVQQVQRARIILLAFDKMLNRERLPTRFNWSDILLVCGGYVGNNPSRRSWPLNVEKQMPHWSTR